MTVHALLDAALAALGAEIGDPAVAQRVRRAEFDKQGALWLDLDQDAAWFRYADGVLKRFLAHQDRKLPLAERLQPGCSAHVLAWRPNRRLVLLDAYGEQERVLKGHRPQRLEQAVSRHRAAEQLASSGAFRVPHLCAVDPDLSALVLERLHGVEAHLSLEHAEDFLAIGSRLARWQAASTDVALEVHSAGDELAVVDGAAERLQRARGSALPGFQQVRERLNDLLPKDPGAPVPCHRDLHDRQFLFGAGQPALLDFDSLCLADAALDPANLLAHLFLRRLQSLAGADQSSVRALGSALIEGLAPRANGSFYAQLRFYQATALLRLSAIYALRPRWAHLGTDLVRLAARCADEAPFLNPR